MSPATASWLATRSLAMNVSALPIFISRPVRRCRTLMPRRVASRAHAKEGDAIAMPRVHVRLDLENEPGERRLGGRDRARATVARLRRRRPFDQRLQDFLDAEVVDRRSEEHRRLPAREKFAEIERRARAAQEFYVVAQRRGLAGIELVEPRIVEALDLLGVAADALAARREAQQAVVAKVEHAAECLAHADRPADRRAVDREDGLDLLEQRERLAHLAVELVDERDDRRRAEPADLEQLDRARLHTLGRVDHHDRRVDRGQHAVGVLGEVLVPRRVEQVDRVAGVLELHHGARHRDATLLLDLHPVRRRVARALARLDRAGEQDRAAVEQQLLRQRRLARVRVRDDRERARRATSRTSSGGKAVSFMGVAEGARREPLHKYSRLRCLRPMRMDARRATKVVVCPTMPRSAAPQTPHRAAARRDGAFRAVCFVVAAAASRLNVRAAHVSLHWNLRSARLAKGAGHLLRLASFGY